MRFEVSYPTGVTHVAEPTGPSAVLGRDPGCDVVLNDTKCSRRHAVVEEKGDRLVVSDLGSANGIYVNGRRVDHAVIAPGDAVKLGDVELRILADLGTTVVSEPAAEGPAPPPPARRAPSPPPARGPAATAKAPPPSLARPGPDGPERPLTVTLLAALWALFVPASVAGVLVGASRIGASPTGWAVASGVGAFAAGLGVAMALGLRSLARWAYRLQIATAALGLVACPLTLTSVTVLLYMTRPEVKQAFVDGRRGGNGAGPAEPTFALSILAMLGLGLAVSVMAFLVATRGR
jgi:hypothetical protein